ncbi:hypothetical protein C8R44DRAFT_729689 [Mycena epipterygia]|nr:hypothetical protein C8R44DRAFT_729689 [Mycena epipterygia]
MPYCSGCNKNFRSIQGYSGHFSKMLHEACLEIRYRFTGDFFGDDYVEDDFGYISDSGGGPQHSDSNDDLVDPTASNLVDAAHARDEEGWEPERGSVPLVTGIDQDSDMQDVQNVPQIRPPPSRETRTIAEDRFHQQPIIEKFPGARAGEIISTERAHSAEEKYCAVLGDLLNPYAPFTSKMDWEVTRWAKICGSGSTAFTDLLKINGVRDELGISYGTSAQLNKVMDKDLPGRPQFMRSEVIVGGESLDMYSRDIIACVRALFGDTDFAPYLFVSTQKAVEENNPGATIIPILLSSDKTQLTVFGSRSAYPVYMTIGNIPKEIRCKPLRRAYVLLAYLPTSCLSHITGDASRRRTLSNLFHACLSHITAPLCDAGVTGLQMASGDGKIRRGHPIVACYIGDYPEQVLITCVKAGECPTCEEEHGSLGDNDSTSLLRHLDSILDALDTLDQGDTAYAKACTAAGIKPVVHPFWENLPYTNIFTSITSDILHQLYQGIIKHLISWIKETYGEAELDARCRRLPPNHNICVFTKGISKLNQVTGKEHDQIARFLLGIIIDMPLPGSLSPVRLVHTVRATLDFVYLAQYPLHSTETLAQLANARERFHENKSIFFDLGVRDNFNLHWWNHYHLNITFYGTSDNYNTEYTERLHIDLAKDAYRATNSKDEFPQMTLWLERKEKILRHVQY